MPFRAQNLNSGNPLSYGWCGSTFTTLTPDPPRSIRQNGKSLPFRTAIIDASVNPATMTTALFWRTGTSARLSERRIISDTSNANTQGILEAELNDFTASTRTRALHELLARTQRGEIAVHPEFCGVNMHAHTFYSFNAYGHSPSSLVWLARKRGYQAIGSVDFDVLDAVDEFLDACEVAVVRGSCAIETRVYIPEFATREMSSPGEPGVAYHMGIGFTSSRASGKAASILANMRQRATQRYRDLIERVNS